MNSYSQEVVDKYDGMISEVSCPAILKNKKQFPAQKFYILGKASVGEDGRPYGQNVFNNRNAIFGWISRMKKKGLPVIVRPQK